MLLGKLLMIGRHHQIAVDGKYFGFSKVMRFYREAIRVWEDGALAVDDVLQNLRGYSWIDMTEQTRQVRKACLHISRRRLLETFVTQDRPEHIMTDRHGL